MKLHDLDEINKIVSAIPYINILEEFRQVDIIVEGKISVKNIEGLNENIEFDVNIFPQYPFKSGDSEAIKFVNKNLIPYNHVMGDGSICIHTLHSPNLNQKLLADFESLKGWLEKYYISNGKDSHYEHIILNEQTFDNIYFSYQFTNVDHTFTRGGFGQVELISLSNGIYKKKIISNFLIKSFQSYSKSKKIVCKWSDHYMNLEVKHTGLFIFLKNVPATYNRFGFSNWVELQRFLPDDFIELMYDLKKTKDKTTLLPIFFGYETVNNEIHWISNLVKLNEIPVIGTPKRDSSGNKIKGQWKGVITEKNIDWAITRNSSYKYLFGRGTFCDKVTKAKILIIGLGAIGSMVAKTLVKCGTKDISIVDYDVKEPENVCRSEYNFSNGLYDKTFELIKILQEHSPFIDVKFHNNNEYFESFIKVFHKDKKLQKEYEESLNQFDIIFNCSTDNDLMYILNKLKLRTELINLSTTNHANDLVCAFYPNIYNFVQNQFINVLDNDIEDLYNPTGCWSPTFRASYNDISILVQYALKVINTQYKQNKQKHNFTLSNSDSNLDIKLTQY